MFSVLNPDNVTLHITPLDTAHLYIDGESYGVLTAQLNSHIIFIPHLWKVIGIKATCNAGMECIFTVAGPTIIIYYSSGRFSCMY